MLILTTGAFLWWNPLGWWREPPRFRPLGQPIDVKVSAPAPWDAPLLMPLEPDLVGDAAEYAIRFSAWRVERFRRDIESLRKREGGPSEIEVSVTVHTSPITPASILENLDDRAREHRAIIEEQIVENTLLVFVPGVSAEGLMRFHLFSRFEVVYGSPSAAVDLTLFGPVAEKPLHFPVRSVGGDSVPRNQGLRREITDQVWLKKPTGYTNTIVLDLANDVKVYRYDLFKDEPPDGGSPIRLSSGIFLTKDCEGGALIFNHLFYQGQKIPNYLTKWAPPQIADSYRTYGKLYLEHAARWLAENPAPKRRS